MRAHAVVIALLAGALGACSECKAPEGCLSAAYVQGACQCLEWQVVSVENAPAKFVVLNVVYSIPGSHSDASYGPRLDSSGLRSVVGGRWRSVVRDAGGSERVAALGRLDLGQTYPWVGYHVTATSGAVAYGPDTGIGISSTVDVPATTRDLLQVWVNPVATVSTDYAGNRTVDWSWSESCFGVPCTGALEFWFTPAAVDGTAPPPAGSAEEMFLASLTDAERAALLRYHPLYDPPGRDPATLASDPRFLSLGQLPVHTWPVGAVMGTDLWTPCPGTLNDVDFPVLHDNEVPFGNGALAVQHSVQSISASCSAQSPHFLLMAGSQCVMEADFYLDRAFGTVIGVPTSASAGCTAP